MMSDRNKIKALLDGRLSETEAQRLLEQLDSGDLERLMGAEELETRMVAYRERNPVAPGKTPELPPRDVDRMWAEISATPPEAVPSVAAAWEATRGLLAALAGEALWRADGRAR